MTNFRYILKNLWNRKLRSLLTVLSILIGVSAIFSLVSFGFGIQDYVNSLAQKAGTDKIFVMAKGTGAPGLDPSFTISKEDVDYIENIKGVNEVAPLYAKVGEVEFKDEKEYSFVIGFDPKKFDFVIESFGIGILRGRELKPGEINKVALGYNYQFADKIFSRAIDIGDKIKINDVPFKVVGFFEEVGNPQDDSQMYLTEEGMESLYDDIEGKYGWVMVRSDKGEKPAEVADKIKIKFRKFKGEDEGKESFFVQTFEDAIATFTSVINVINGVLVLIAFVSLVVAFINIMNTMYTAVLERTREIGVMKAIGATNNEILRVFVYESGFVGLLGGLMGVILGWMIASTGGYIAANAGYALLKPIFPWYLTLGSLLFAFFVGALAGYLPARQASQLQPVDALRYE